MEDQRQQGFARSLTDDDTPNLTAALHYAARGFRIVPLWPIDDHGHCTCNVGARCNSAGKHPHVTGWKREATDDPDTLRPWWLKWPTAGLGAVLDGLLFVVDDDPPHGERSLAELERTHGALPETLTHRTGRGGGHRFYRASEAVECIDGLLPGIDIKGRGGLVVLPPSLHKNGSNYAVELAAPIADAPPWLLTIVDIERARKSEAPRFSQGSGAQKTRALSESETGPVPEGRRSHVLLSELGRRWNGATFTVADAYAYAEDYQRTRCATGTHPFTIAEAHAVAKFITSKPKQTHATAAPSLATLTDSRRELAKLLALEERIDWRAFATRGDSQKRPAQITRTANTLRHVYRLVLELAYERDTLTPALAVRELAERGRLGKATVSTYLRLLRFPKRGTPGLLSLERSWGKRTRTTWTGTRKAMGATFAITPAATVETSYLSTVFPSPRGARDCTQFDHFPPWLLATRNGALGPNAPRALAILAAGALRTGGELGAAMNINAAAARRLLVRLAAYGLAERVGKRGWQRGPVEVSDLAVDDRLEAARRAAVAQHNAHEAERAADRWRHRLARTMGEKPKPSKLTLVPEPGETDRTGSPRSDATRPIEPSAWGKNLENPPDERAEHMGRW